MRHSLLSTPIAQSFVVFAPADDHTAYAVYLPEGKYSQLAGNCAVADSAGGADGRNLSCVWPGNLPGFYVRLALFAMLRRVARSDRVCSVPLLMIQNVASRVYPTTTVLVGGVLWTCGIKADSLSIDCFKPPTGGGGSGQTGSPTPASVPIHSYRVCALISLPSPQQYFAAFAQTKTLTVLFGNFLTPTLFCLVNSSFYVTCS